MREILRHIKINYVFCKDHRYGVLAIDFDNSISFNSLLIEGLKTMLAQACEKILQSIVDDKFKLLILRTKVKPVY